MNGFICVFVAIGMSISITVGSFLFGCFIQWMSNEHDPYYIYVAWGTVCIVLTGVIMYVLGIKGYLL